MSGFEFTPQGILPLGAPTSTQGEGAIAGATAQAPPQHAMERVAVRPPVLVVAQRIEQPTHLKPIDVIKLARRRLREVERDIRRIKALERERDELKRLLDAADNRPRAVVRELSAKRG